MHVRFMSRKSARGEQKAIFPVISMPEYLMPLTKSIDARYVQHVEQALSALCELGAWTQLGFRL